MFNKNVTQKKINKHENLLMSHKKIFVILKQFPEKSRQILKFDN